MKVYYLICLLLLPFITLTAQVAVTGHVTNTPTASAPDEVGREYAKWEQRMLEFSEQLALVKAASDTAVAQIKAIEALGEGDIDAIFNFIELQARTSTMFNDLLQDADMTDPNMIDFRDKMAASDATLQNLASLTGDLDNLIDNTEYRAEQFKRNMRLSGRTTSTVGQLQLLSSNVGLMQGGIRDMLRVNASAAKFDAVVYEQQQLKKENDKKKAKKWTEIDEIQLESEVSDSEYDRAVNGTEYTTEGLF